MDDLKAMLNFGSVAVQAKAVKKLVEKIVISTSKTQPLSSDSGKKPAEFDFLLENCCNDNPTVSHICCEAVRHLVVNGHVEWKFSVTQLLGVLYSTDKGVDAVIQVVGRLLYAQMQGELQAGFKYKCPFGLRNPTHPFVLILREKPSCWPSLLKSIQLCFEDHRGWETFEMFTPVFTYTLLNPQRPAEHAAFRSLLWQKLPDWASRPHQVSLLKDVLAWLPLETEQQLSEAVSTSEACLPEAVRLNPRLRSWCCAYGLSVSHAACRLHVNSLPLLTVLCDLCEPLEEGDALTGVCFVISAAFLAVAPSVYIAKLCQICGILLGKTDPSPPIASVLSLPVIQIVMHPPDGFGPPSQSTKLQSVAVQLLMKVEEACSANADDKNRQKRRFEASDVTLGCLSRSTFDAVLAAKLLQEYGLKETASERSVYVDALRDTSADGSRPDFTVVLMASAVIALSDDEMVVRKAFDVVVDAATVANDLGPMLFSLILYKLSRSTQPRVILSLFEVLPRTAVHKYCIPTLYNALQALSVEPVLKASSIVCFVNLYKRQPQCFPLLFKALQEEEADALCEEVLLAKAAAMLDVIKHDCSLHGVDMLSPISAIIDKRKKYHETAAVVLALRGLCELCKTEVVDVRTTLNAVMPKLWRDQRPLVLSALYELMSVVPRLSVPSIEYERYEKELVAKLWKVATKGQDHVTVGGAYRALAAFPTSYHTLKVLPSEAKRNLKIPRSQASTPLELAQDPEDVLKYTPGYCFIDLLQSIDDADVLKDYSRFLSALLVNEVKDMPRSAYSLSQTKHRDSSRNQQLKGIPQLLGTLYETNRYPGVQSSVAVGVLLTGEAPLQLDCDGNPLKKSIFLQCKFYEHLLSTLLQDVPLDAGDWYRSLLVTTAWSGFMRRAFHAAEESRRAELEHLRSHGKLPGNAEEVTAQFNRSWLWARDTLTAAVQKNCSGRASQQANGLLALSALLVAVAEYYDGLDTTLKQSAARDENHVGHAEWSDGVLNLIVACIDGKLGPGVGTFDWIFKSSAKTSAGGSALLRGCASVGASWVVPYLHRKDPTLIPTLLEKLMNQLALEQSKPAQLLVGIGLGLFVQAATREGLLSGSGEAQGVRARGLVKYVVKNLMTSNFANADVEPKIGELVCLTLCLSGLGQSGDEELKNLVLVGCAKFCEVLHAMDSDLCSFEVLCVCAAVLICNAASTLLTVENVEELLLWFESRRQSNSQCVGTAVSLGLLVCTLSEMNHPKAGALCTSLYNHWISILGSEGQPTLGRLAALKGLCIMVGGGKLLLTGGGSRESSSENSGRMKQVCDLLVNILNTSKDTGLLNHAAWLLGELHVVGSGQARNTSSVPTSYAYLSDQSVLRPLTDFLAAFVRSGAVSAHLRACLSALRCEFPRALPPFNWTALFTPLMKNDCVPELAALTLDVALRNGVSSPSMGAFLTACVSEPLLHNLSSECVDLLLSSIPTVVRAVPATNLKPFLKMVSIRATASTSSTEGVVKGLTRVLKMADLPTGTSSLVNETVVEIFRKVQRTFDTHLASGSMRALSDCFLLLSEPCQDCLLDGLTCIPMVIYLNAQLCIRGRRPYAACNPFEAACSLPREERTDTLKLLLRCMDFGNETKTSKETTRWFVDCLVAAKETAENPAPDVPFLQYQLQLVSLIAAALNGLYVRKNLIHHHNLPDVLLMLLPGALRSLLDSPEWKSITQVVLDWLLNLLSKPAVQNLKPLLLGCIRALRSTDEYKSSAWVQSLSQLGH